MIELGTAMKRALPPWVVDVKPEPMEDWQGEVGLCVCVFIDPEKDDVFTDAQQLLAIKKIVREVLVERDVQLFPYFRFLLAPDPRDSPSEEESEDQTGGKRST